MNSANTKVKDVNEITICGACRSKSLKVTHDFGDVPIAGYFPMPSEPIRSLLPMKLLYCENCTLHQISPDISDDHLFQDYRYISSIGMQTHFDELAIWFQQYFEPAKESKIVELGCNDGPLLSALTTLGYSPVGVDPASNIVQLATKKGLTVINDFFSKESVSKYQELQNIDYLFSSNSFAHISDIHSVAKAVSNALGPSGLFIVEVQSFIRLIQTNAFDFVYHEHKYYYTISSISKLFNHFGLHLIDCLMTESHGGSYRLIFGKIKPLNELSIDLLTRSEVLLETSGEEVGMALSRYFRELRAMDDFIFKSFNQGQRIIAFGASGRGNMLLGQLPKTRKILQYVIDESPERIGRLMGQNETKIISFDEVDCEQFDIVIILAWNFKNQIIKKWRNQSSKFVVPLPFFDIIEN